MSKINVLIVEDNKYSAFAMHEIVSRFENVGSCCIAKTIYAAQKKALSQRVDIIFLDLRLPDSHEEQDTLSLIKTIFYKMPVITVTATSKIELAIDAIKAGAMEHLIKGDDTNPRQLYAVILKAIARKELQSQKYIKRLRDSLPTVAPIKGSIPAMIGGF